MWCTTARLVNDGDDYTDTRLLPCRSWRCDHCAPRRRAQLMAVAASGEPNKCLTLTVGPKAGESIVARYKALHNAWKILGKRILRQFAMAPHKRWMLTTPEGYQYQEIRSWRNTVKVMPKEYAKLHYMSFAEETKRGEPHIHILLRSPYIPQRWLSQQMQELIKSPIVWVERIKSQRQAIGYVSKYVTKAPAQFGKARRYWVSKEYEVNKGEYEPKPRVFRQFVRVVRQRFEEFAEQVIVKGLLPYPLADGWIRLYTLNAAVRAFGEPDTEKINPNWYRMSVEYGRLEMAIGVHRE